MTNKFNLKQGIKKYYPLGFLFLIIFGFVLIQTAKAKEISVGTASDNIGIGTSAPGTTYRLNVNGNSNITGTLNVTGGITGGSLSTTYLSAGNVSAGNFGSNSGGGNYSFPGNLSFSASNPVLSSPSYFVIPGGAYFSGGTVYTESTIQARGGIHNDSGTYLSVNGGTSGITYFPGSIGIGTTNPGVTLDVNGHISTSAAGGSARQSNYDLSAWSAAVGQNLYSYGSICAGNGSGSCSSSGGVTMSASATVGTPNVALSGSGTSYFNSGNVGIGTTNPLVKLDVKGKLFLDNSGTYSTTYSWAGGAIQTNSLELMDRYGGSVSDGVYPTLTFHDYGNGGAQFSMEGSTATLHLGSGASNSAGTLAGSGGYFSKLKIWGALETTGTISAGSFSGPMSGTLNAANLSAGTFGANTGGGNYAFPGWARFEGILNTDNAFEKVLPAISFVNGAANQAVDLNLGNVSFWGYIEVEVNSTYNYQNANGKLTKIFAVGTNPGGSIYNNESRVSDALGTIPDNIAIGDLVWDGANSTFKIPISHIVSSGNTFVVKVRMFTAAGAKNVFDNLALSGVYSLSALPRNYVNYNGNVGIGTTAPSGKLNISEPSGTVNNAGSGSLVLDHGNSGGASSIVFRSTANRGSDYGYIQYQDSSTVGAGGESARLILGTSNDADDHLVLMPTGNVGVGIMDPGKKLDVAGDIRVRGNIYTDNNYGNGLIGVYDSTRYQGVFSMGDAYKLAADGTSPGNLYGLAWSHPNAGGVAGNLNTHGLLVMENGTFLAAISGSIRSRDDMQSPIFYDRNDTSYYADPNSTSRLNNLTVTGAYNGPLTSTPGGGVITPSDGLNSSLAYDRMTYYDGYGGAVTNGPGQAWVGALTIGAANRGLQIAGGYVGDVYFRNGAGGWGGWNKFISSANIGSQSVNYANSAGSTTNSTNSSYTTYQSFQPTRTGDWASNFSSVPAANRGWGEVSSGGPQGTWWFMDNMRHSNASNVWGTQVAWGWEDNANQLWQRNVSGGSWTAWVKYLNSSNYNSYAPTLSGGGASGNWGIDISGKVNGADTNPDGSHPGTGIKPFYSWNKGRANNASAGYSNGISIGSNPGDQSYGFQIVQNMWDDNLYFRRYNAGWQTWYSVVYKDSANNSVIGGTMTAGGFIYNSDIKLKKNIATIESPLTKILQLRGVTFNWKKDNTPGVGLIAQEVEKVFPELVSESSGIKSVQYGNLVAPLIEAVKEQQKEIQSLNERIKVLETK